MDPVGKLNRDVRAACGEPGAGGMVVDASYKIEIFTRRQALPLIPSQGEGKTRRRQFLRSEQLLIAL
jgi:hypothetical protein